MGDNHDLYMTHVSSPTTPKGEKTQQLDILVLGGLGGRVDQGFSQIHHLYVLYEEKRRTKKNEQEGDLFLLSEESLSFIISPGKNIIHTPFTHRPDLPESEAEKEIFSENVGIVPVSGPTLISLRGFEWDVTNWRTEIGGQVSTSNHIRSDRIEVDVDVDTNRAVLFTVELGERFKRVVSKAFFFHGVVGIEVMISISSSRTCESAWVRRGVTVSIFFSRCDCDELTGFSQAFFNKIEAYDRKRTYHVFARHRMLSH